MVTSDVTCKLLINLSFPQLEVGDPGISVYQIVISR